VNEQNHNSQQNQPSDKKGFSAEQIVLFLGLFGFVVFLWIIGFLLLAMVSGRSATAMLPAPLVEIAATQGFVLPPTWTPTPAETAIATPTPTAVWDGQAPTRIYTPRATSLPGLPMPGFAPKTAVLDLARIMQGESPGDPEAAYMVGWVAKNRLLHPGYGDTYYTVSHGFFGYRADIQPSKKFLGIAQRVIRAKQDPTGGCLYALSRTDITKLGVPPGRADVAFGEWFFFKTWPLTYPNK
jgi:hypothetical protein